MSVMLSKKDAYRVMFKEYPDVVTAEQMSEMLGISSKTAYRLLHSNAIEHLKVGRIYKVPKIYILAYLNVIKNN